MSTEITKWAIISSRPNFGWDGLFWVVLICYCNTILLIHILHVWLEYDVIFSFTNAIKNSIVEKWTILKNANLPNKITRVSLLHVGVWLLYICYKHIISNYTWTFNPKLMYIKICLVVVYIYFGMSPYLFISLLISQME